MRNYLTSLARRGAGLTMEQFPQPSHTPNFPAELKGVESNSSPSMQGEAGSTSPHPATSDSARATPTPIAEHTPHLTAQPADETSRARVRDRVEGKDIPKADSSGARIEPSEISPRLSQPSQTILPDVKTKADARAQPEQSINAAPNIRPSTRSPLPIEATIKDESPKEKTLNDESSLQLAETSSLQPESRQSAPAPATLEPSTILERETALIVPTPTQMGARVVPQPQSPATSLTIPRASEAAPDEQEPRIEVRIGRVEVRFAQAPPQLPAPGESRRPRGFRDYALARRYLDRNWY